MKVFLLIIVGCLTVFNGVSQITACRKTNFSTSKYNYTDTSYSFHSLKKLRNEKDTVMSKLHKEYIANRNNYENGSMTKDDFDRIKKKYQKDTKNSIVKYNSIIDNRREDLYYFRIGNRVRKKQPRKFPMQIGFAGNSVDSRLFYDGESAGEGVSYFSNTGIIVSGKDQLSTTIYSEFVHDYFGPVRVGFSSQISTSQPIDKDSLISLNDEVLQSNDAFQNLLGGGGNLAISFNYPLLYFKPRGVAEGHVSVSNIASFDLPRVGTLLNDPIFKMDMGFDYSFYLYGNSDRLTLFFNGRSSALWASKGAFYDQLNRTGDKKIFIFNKFTFGASIMSSVQLSISIYKSNGFVDDDFPMTVGIALTPKNKK